MKSEHEDNYPEKESLLFLFKESIATINEEIKKELAENIKQTNFME